jgi:hypothetical protein
MTELERFQKVNQCETEEQLAAVILEFADESGMIQGRNTRFVAKVMSERVEGVVSLGFPANSLTREFGIRQQALYIKHYTQKPIEPARVDVSDTIEELSDLSKMFDDRISDCYQVKGLQQARHAFILYRSVVWNAIKSLKQI